MKLRSLIPFLLACSIIPSASSCGSQLNTPDVPTVKITDNGASDYYVVRADLSSKALTALANELRAAIEDASGVQPGIVTDWKTFPVYEHEIIIDETLREEDLDFTIDRVALGETGFIIKEHNGKIYISGGEEAGTIRAVEYFIDQFVKAGQDVVIPEGYEHIVYHEYDISALYINGNKVDKDWKILVPSGADETLHESAERLQTAIREKCGMLLEISVGGTDQPNAFILSENQPETAGMHSIYVDRDRLIFESSAQSGLSGCVDRFIGRYITDQFGKFNFPADYKLYEIGDYMIIKYPD